MIPEICSGISLTPRLRFRWQPGDVTVNPLLRLHQIQELQELQELLNADLWDW